MTIRSLRTKMQFLHLISWRAHFSEESPENLQKLSIYAKFPHQEGNQVEKLISKWWLQRKNILEKRDLERLI